MGRVLSARSAVLRTCVAPALLLTCCATPAAPTPTPTPAPVSSEIPRDAAVAPTAPVDAGAPQWALFDAAVPSVVDAGTDAALPPAAVFVWLPRSSSAIHTHGGDAAHLSQARFVAKNSTSRRVSFRVNSAEFLTSNKCDVAPYEPRRAITPVRLVRAGTTQDPLFVSVAPMAEVEFTVVFAPAVDAYYTHCNRFAFRIRGSSNGTPMEITSETHVQREDP
jgi:hypothetical protein